MVDGGRLTPELARWARQALAGRAAAGLAEEINDLLVGVVTVAEAAKSAESLLELRRAVETCEEHGRKIGELVRAFQAACGSSAPETAASECDVAAALDRALLLCDKNIRLRGIEVRRDYGKLPRVKAEVGLIEQVVLELLLEALDAMSGGGVLELTARREGESVAVTVSHGGAPAPPADIGGPTGPTAESVGLVIAGQVIRSCGGELITGSALGSGSRFMVLLPVSRQNSAG